MTCRSPLEIYLYLVTKCTLETVWCDPLCLPAAVVCRLITDLLCRRRTGVMGHDDVCVCPVLERAKAKVAKVEEA